MFSMRHETNGNLSVVTVNEKKTPPQKNKTTTTKTNQTKPELEYLAPGCRHVLLKKLEMIFKPRRVGSIKARPSASRE